MVVTAGVAVVGKKKSKGGHGSEDLVGNADYVEEQEMNGSTEVKTLSQIRREHLRRGKEHSFQTEHKHWLIDHTYFEGGISCAAVLNAIFIGLAYDHTSGPWPKVWEASEHVFTAIFFVEMVLKLWVLKLRYFQDRWNWLDFALVVPAVIDNWILSWALSDEGAMSQLTILRIARLARFIRIFRMTKMLKELMNLIEALVYSVKTMAWAYVLLMILIYLYALLCVEFIGSEKGVYPGRSENDDEMAEYSPDWNNYQFFGTVPRAMYSLFSIITLSEFAVTTRPIFERQPVMVLVLITFTCLSAFGIMNVVIGLMVQQALDASNSLAEEKEAAEMKLKMDRIRLIKEVLEKMNTDGDPNISIKELAHGLDDQPQLVDLMMQIDLPPNITVREIFTLIDVSGDGNISPKEFLVQLLRLVDCTQFQQICLMQISMNEVKKSLFAISRKLETLSGGSQSKMKTDEVTSLSESADKLMSIRDSAMIGGMSGLMSETLIGAMSELKEELKKDLEQTRHDVLSKIGSASAHLESNLRHIAAHPDSAFVESSGQPWRMMGFQGAVWEQLPTASNKYHFSGTLPVSQGDGNGYGGSRDVLEWQKEGGADAAQGRPTALKPNGFEGGGFLRSCSSCERVDTGTRTR